MTGTVGPDRAVAVVMRERRVLVVGRRRAGRCYAVLPGGGVEVGESALDAVVRELEEETGLVGHAVEVLWDRDDGGRRAVYFRVQESGGTALLGGPERRRSSPDNQYDLRWVGLDDLGDLALQPPEIVPLVSALLRSTDPSDWSG